MKWKILLLVGFLAIFLLCIGIASGTNDPPQSGGTVNGDWTVTDTRSYSDVSISVQNGNLYINNGGKLTLNRVTLTMTSSSDGKYSIEVKNGGTLILNGTTVTSSSSSIHYKFIIRGAATINSSIIREMWGDGSSWEGGIQIYSSQVTITNSTIENGKTGGIYIKGANPTIKWNTIRNNGRDSPSKYYVYGIYAISSKATIHGNTITDNWRQTLLRSYTTQSTGYYPNGWGHHCPYTGYWYYYSSWGRYYYRYISYYTYIYTYYEYSGFGIYIDTGSNLKLTDNKITYNGAGTGSYSHSYSYGGRIYEGTFHGYPHYHYIYRYTYRYSTPYSTGCGIYMSNASSFIHNNSIQYNGHTERFSGYSWYMRYTYYFNNGYGIYSINSTPTITNNDIKYSRVDVYCNKSISTIMNNTMTIRYRYRAYVDNNYSIGGVFMHMSKGIVKNNTISMKMSSYIGSMGEIKYYVPSMLGIMINQSKNVQIVSNNIKYNEDYDGAYYNPEYGIYIYQCQPTVQGNTITMSYSNNRYKYRNSMTGIYIMSNKKLSLKDNIITISANARYFESEEIAKGLHIDKKSNVVIYNCTVSASGSKPKTIGIYGSFRPILTITGGSIVKCTYGIWVQNYGIIKATGINITGTSIGMYCEWHISIDVSDSHITSNGVGLESYTTKGKIVDSIFSNGVDFRIYDYSYIDVINTSFAKSSVEVLENSYLNISWYVHLRLLWQNDAPVSGATVWSYSILGILADKRKTNENGWTDRFTLMEMSMGDDRICKYTPYKLVVFKGRISSTIFITLNSSIERTYTIMDYLPPIVNIVSPQNPYYTNHSEVSISGNIWDNESGVCKLEFSVDGSMWSEIDIKNDTWTLDMKLDDGNHIITIRGTDNVGNSESVLMNIYVDTVGPSLRIITPPDGFCTNIRNVEIIGISDEDSEVEINGVPVCLMGRYFTYNYSLNDGENIIIVTSRDNIGNIRLVKIRVILDTIPPELVIESPTDKSIVRMNPVHLQGTTDGNFVYINGKKIDVGEDGKFERNIVLYEGMNTIEVIAEDVAGNRVYDIINVVLDTRPPSLSISNPNNGIWISTSSIIVSGTTEKNAIVKINGRETAVMGISFSANIVLKEGKNVIEITAEDSAGNVNKVVREVFVDTIPPYLVLTNPPDNHITKSKYVLVMGSTDWLCELTVNDYPIPVEDFIFSTTVELNEGENVIVVNSTDLAGNIVTVKRRVVYDPNVPIITIYTPLPGDIVKTKYISVEGETEPGATLIINNEIIVKASDDGKFAIDVPLDEGINRITIKAVDDAHNEYVSSVEVIRKTTPKQEKPDNSWMMTLAGILTGIGIAFPLFALVYDRSLRKKRKFLHLSEEYIYTPPQYPSVPPAAYEGFPPPPPPPEAPSEKPSERYMPPPYSPSDETYYQETSLIDREGELEVSPGEIEATEMKHHTPPSSQTDEYQKVSPPPSHGELTDKETEVEQAPSDTEIGDIWRRRRV